MRRQRHFQSLFLNTSLKVSTKSESFENESNVDYFTYWRKCDIKKNAEYLLDDKEIQHKNKHRNTKCTFISRNKKAGPM
jgi:hypothetical protein